MKIYILFPSSESSENKWYSCLMPDCMKNCNLGLPKWIKEANWRTVKNCNEKWYITIGMVVFLLAKLVKYLAFEVFFPGYDVYTDIDAANQHFK